MSNTGIAIKDFFGDRDAKELNFTYGALITNIQLESKDRLMGDHRGDRQMFFKKDHIRMLSQQELEFVKEMVRSVFNFSTLYALKVNLLIEAIEVVFINTFFLV